MAPQPAFDGLQPKSDDLQLSCLALLRLLFNLGWRVATATKSVRNSISVSLLVRAQGEPAECPLWTRRRGVCLYLPCSEMYVSRADSTQEA